MYHGYCGVCGMEFTSKFKSPYCLRHRDRVCERCGQPLGDVHGLVKYCEECRLAVHREQSREWWRSRPPARYDKTCAFCGKAFAARYPQTKFCPDCRGADGKARRKAASKKTRAEEKALPPLTIAECAYIDAHLRLKYGEAQARGLHTRSILNQCWREAGEKK